ncbi:MAG TPA: hypothetical protein VG603_03125 [Chitinophagales bacterium]|nr:hypothetical protein [Chitinophagales bacterium]
MRTLELLKAFSDKEIKLIEKEVAEGKRKSLSVLLKELKRFRHKNELPEREKLFAKIYNKPYSKTKDYLLRNELRLLNEIIYYYLATDRFKKEIDENRNVLNLWLAKAFFRRRMWHFEEDIDDYIKQAKEHLQTDILSQLFTIKLIWLSMTANSKNHKNALDMLQDWEAEEKKRFLHRMRKIEYSTIFFENLDVSKKNPSLKKITPGKAVYDFTGIDQTDWYTRYLTLQKYIVQSGGDEQIEYIKEIESIIKSGPARKVIHPDNRHSATNHLAVALVTQGRLEEALFYMEEGIRQFNEEGVPVSAIHIRNYLIALFVSQHYSKAAEVYNKYLKILTPTNMLTACNMYMAYNYLFMKLPDKALGYLPLNNKLTPSENILSRFVYLIAFITRKQYDLALTEVRNMKKAWARDDSGAFATGILSAEYFQTYIRVLIKMPKTTGKQLAALRSGISKLYDITKPPHYDDLQLHWLLQQL